jgi:hypothetical protein
MQLEGARNGPAELGTLVQDNIKLHDGYSIYAWGSCVLDKYMLQTNNPITLRLWVAGTPNATFMEASLVETIILYPGTESGTDLDPTARAGLITRPTGVRAGSFETSQAVMFSPLQVDPSEDDMTVTFFLQAVNREANQDEVCLSLVLWSGADGIGTRVPGDPFVSGAPYIFPHFNSFHKTGSPNGVDQSVFPYDTRCLSANIEDGYSLIGNQWTVAMWMRFDNLDGYNIAGIRGDTVDGGTQAPWSRQTIGVGKNNETARPNRWRELIASDESAQHIIIMELWDRFAHNGGNPISGKHSQEARWQGNTFGERNEKSAIFRWGDAESPRRDYENNAWVFMVWCFEGGDYTGPIPKLRLYMNMGKSALTNEPAMTLMVPVAPGGTTPFSQPLSQDDTGAQAYMFASPNDGVNYHYWQGIYNGDLLSGPTITAGTQYHQIGIWNVALDSAVLGTASNIGPIKALFNEGRGWAVDWKRNTTTFDPNGPMYYLNYQQAENLVHLNQMGAVEEWFQTKQAGRDTGYHLPDWEGALNWTFDVSDQGHEWHRTIKDAHYHQRELTNEFGHEQWYDNLPQSWLRGTDIYDILSPGGTNNTTEYDFSYPGQQMEGDADVKQDNLGYPTYVDWVRSGSNLSELPWLSGPYPPGYHKNDPDRPIKGGT